MTRCKAVFLDRDGVLNHVVPAGNKSFPPVDAEALQLTYGARTAVDHLRAAGYLCICVTNQPDVARGTRTLENVAAMNDKVRESLELDDLLVCLHDDADVCACRKPKPGMLLEAAAKWNIDLKKSWMIGDRATDIEAGKKAGCRCILIRDATGVSAGADHACRNLPAAAEFIMLADGQFEQKQGADMWAGYVEAVQLVLLRLVVTTSVGEKVRADQGFDMWAQMARRLRRCAGSIHLIGNGASASMASHFATDITKNCGIRANVYTDSSLLTALSNDHGFENAYAIALNRYGMAQDLLVAISSSGNSPNIINACREAAGLGMQVVTLSARRGDNTLRTLGTLNFYVPGESFSHAESAHAVVLHHWTDILENAYLERDQHQPSDLR